MAENDSLLPSQINFQLHPASQWINISNGSSAHNECEDKDERRQEVFAAVVTLSKHQEKATKMEPLVRAPWSLSEADTDGKQNVLILRDIWLIWYQVTCKSRKPFNSYKNIIDKEPILDTGLQLISHKCSCGCPHAYSAAKE